MSHCFSNTRRIRESIRQQAQYRTWQEVPLGLRIQILEKVSETVEQIIRVKALDRTRLSWFNSAQTICSSK